MGRRMNHEMLVRNQKARNYIRDHEPREVSYLEFIYTAKNLGKKRKTENKWKRVNMSKVDNEKFMASLASELDGL